jgi:hypothetical protein
MLGLSCVIRLRGFTGGFPKSLNIAKNIDKKLGVESEVVGTRMAQGSARKIKGTNAAANKIPNSGSLEYDETVIEITQPTSEQGKAWQGWGTALKPAFEPVVVGRKPFGKGVTVAENVLAWGVGGLNIDGSRIGSSEKRNISGMKSLGVMHDDNWKPKDIETKEVQGRWPANVILDEVSAGLLDEQSGHQKDGRTIIRNPEPGATRKNDIYGKGWGKLPEDKTYGGSGGASRFFYQAKASKRDRNEGLEELEAVKSAAMNGNLTDGQRKGGDGSDIKTPVRQNFHPTVKPTQLMRYLIKLVTPAGGVVLDPFTGSGSTGKAALLDGFKFVGVELTAEYLPIIEGRLRWAMEQEGETDERLF